MIQALKKKVISLQNISQEEALALSQTTEKEELYKAADELRKHFCHDLIDLCSITIARSGKRTEDCKCALNLCITKLI